MYVIYVRSRRNVGYPPVAIGQTHAYHLRRGISGAAQGRNMLKVIFRLQYKKSTHRYKRMFCAYLHAD